MPKNHQIYTYDPRLLEKREARRLLQHLHRFGSITARDEQILSNLRDFGVMSFGQIARLHWPDAELSTAHRRLYTLSGPRYHLLGRVSAPLAAGWPAADRVALLGTCGYLHLQHAITTERAMRHTKPNQLFRDLVMAEVYVRLVGALRHRAGWRMAWTNIPAAEEQPALPTAQVALTGPAEQPRAFHIQLVNHHVDWSRLIDEANPASEYLLIMEEDSDLQRVTDYFTAVDAHPALYLTTASKIINRRGDILRDLHWVILPARQPGQPPARRRDNLLHTVHQLTPAQKMAAIAADAGIPAAGSHMASLGLPPKYHRRIDYAGNTPTAR